MHQAQLENLRAVDEEIILLPNRKNEDMGRKPHILFFTIQLIKHFMENLELTEKEKKVILALRVSHLKVYDS